MQKTLMIDSLCIHLPYSMKSQASQFAHSLAHALANYSYSKAMNIKSLSLLPVTMKHGETISDIAAQVAHRIHHLVQGGQE